MYKHIDLELFIQIIRTNPEPLTTARIAELAGCSWNTAERYLFLLERVDRLSHETSSGPKGQIHLWRMAGDGDIRMVEKKTQS